MNIRIEKLENGYEIKVGSGGLLDWGSKTFVAKNVDEIVKVVTKQIQEKLEKYED